MASMRYLADFPRPHCLVLKLQIGDLGLIVDMKCHANKCEYPAEAMKQAQKRIFKKGGSINYWGIKDRLTDTSSWVPTEVGSTCIAPPSTPDSRLLGWLLLERSVRNYRL